MILYVLSGLPGAGKTTRALEISHAKGAILLCRDELRVSYRSVVDEGHLTLIMASQARSFLQHGYDVVVDSWNLTEGDEALWHELARECACAIRWIHLTTPVELCVERDATRPLSIGAECVRGTAMEFAARLVKLSEV